MRKLVHVVIAATLVLASGAAVHAQTPCPGSPTIDQPANGATGVTRGPGNTVTLKWAHLVGAAGTTAYDVFFGSPGTGCNTVRATVSTATRTWSPPSNEIVDGASYEWKVVAKGGTSCPTAGAPSTCAAFTMQSCPTTIPVLNSPANGSTVPPGNVTLQWQGVASASFYEVFIAIDNGPVTMAGTTTATQKQITVEPGRAVGWTVRAARIGCNGTLASGFGFTTSCPTTPPSLTTPAAGARFSEGTSITFSWTAVDGASGYDVEYAPAGSANWQPLGERSATRTRTGMFAAGTWIWRVRAAFAGGCPPLVSQTSTFSVSAPCSNTAPALISPADGSAHTLPVTLTWGSTATASEVQVFVTGPNGTQLIGTTTGNSLVVNSLAPGTYQWYAVAKYLNCPDVESARRTLIIRTAECPPGTITLTSPANGATVVSPVTLAWTALANATAYRVWGQQDGGVPVLVTNTQNTTATVSLPAGNFKWKVEGLREGCPSIFSGDGNFIIAAAANCGANLPPQLGTPIIRDEPVPAGKSVVLPWIAQTRATFHRVWLSKNGSAFEDVGVTRGDVTQLERVLLAGSYRWFVQAFFENCTLLTSSTGEFVVEDSTPRCSIEKPVIAEPIEGSTVTKLRFRVVEVTVDSRFVKYRFFAIVDRTNAAADAIFLGSSTTPEFEPELQLPPGTYDVAVEKAVEGCPSTFSDKVTVTIARAQNCNTAAPLLQSPPNGATNVPPDVEFIWVPQGSPVVGTKYVLFVQVNDGAATPVAFTTETRIMHRVPPGRIRWWIVAFPPGCDPAISQRFAFTVELSEACATNPPLALQPDPVEEISERGVLFAWTRVPLATKYHIWLWKLGDAPAEVASTTELKTQINVSEGDYGWFIEAEIPNCASIRSALGELKVIAGAPCGTPGKPRAHVVGRALSGSEYRLRWSALANVKTWEVQESPFADFTTGEIFLVTDTEYVTSKTIPAGSAQFHYRVRGLLDCNDERTSYSDPVSIIVIAPVGNDVSVDFGTTGDVTQQISIPGTETPSTFSITVDKPGVTASPSSGPLTKDGATVTLTSRRDQLRLGGNTATVKVSVDTPSSGSSLQSHATTVITIPINVSLVTPVTPSGKSSPPPDALIFSGVGHAPGQNNSFFESDVRLVNLSAQTMKYQLNYTPTGTDGTVTGQTTTVEIAPNQSLALDDIVNTVFGLGETSGALGMLEARPLTSSTSSGGLISSISSTAQQLLTLGSSRTYNFTPTGTFGQFVPAIPFAKFVGLGKILSLQQVAQSTAYRANFGFLEASGQPVNLLVRAYDAAGVLLATIPVDLMASEHKQIGLMLASNGITDLQDGRVEVEVVGGSGKISAYVSEVDNSTNDSLLVTGVEKASVMTNRYVVPGMAHKDLGFAFWVSDLRIFNAGATQVPATLTFYTEANPGSFVTRQVTIEPGEIEVLNDVVQNFFGQPNGAGGSIVVTTPSDVPLDVTSRTYNQTTNGTYGQFIPGFTVADSVGVGESALHILQVEHSSRFRTNFALNETTGNPVTVEVALTLPDSIVTPIVTYGLAANEFRQFSVGDFQLPDAVYNGRLTVKVIGGTGKVTAFGSLIDMSTNDPTNIPPQR